MVRHTIVTACLLLFSAVNPAMAQPGRESRDAGGPTGGQQVPAPGTMLPDVNAFDEQGKEFSTASLRGSYTVLVFGCLT